jgi:hypothetical protein
LSLQTKEKTQKNRAINPKKYRVKNENTGRGETEEKNREARRNTKRNNTRSRGEKGQHTHRQGLIVPAIVLSLQKQKTKTTIGIHSKPASSLLFPSSSQNLLEEESRPRAQEQKKAEEGAEERRGEEVVGQPELHHRLHRLADQVSDFSFSIKCTLCK